MDSFMEYISVQVGERYDTGAAEQGKAQILLSKISG